MGADALLPWFGGGPTVLVTQRAGLPVSATATATATARSLCCDVVTIDVGELFP